MKQILRKTLLILVAGVMCNAAWADDILVPSPVYFNDFATAVSGQDGIEIIGNGVFENDADARFGRIFHNDPTLTKAKRTNYLKLPANVLSYSGTTKEMTIGFWVNMKDAADFYWSPLFTAYPNAEKASDSSEPWPIFTCLARKVVSLNCWGYCDLGNTYNDKGTNAETSAWLDDKGWHYYTITLTSTTVKVYIDGVVENSWTVDGTTAGQIITGLFDAGAAYTDANGLKYICLGGNQSNNFNDPDPAFGFDDFAVYNVALSKEQIDQIRANKLNRTVTGTQIGTKDCGTAGLGAMTTKKRLYPGDSYSYRFINYNNGGTANFRNYLVPVYNPSDVLQISVRADNWENMHHVGEVWGSNAGCTSDFNWTNFPGNMNGATIDMTVSFTADKKYTMSSTINTVDGSTWHYSYTNDYEGTSIDLTSYDYIQAALSVENAWLDVLSEGYSAIGAAIGATGWGTFASDYNLDFTGITDIEAYKVTGATGSAIDKAQLTGIVPAGTPMLLNAPSGAGTYTVPVATSAGTPITGNCLLRGTGAAVSQDGSYDRYVLVNDGGAKFKKILSNPATVAANRAYLQFTAGSPSRDILSIDGGDATGINMVNGEGLKVNGTEVYYNLQGQRVLYPTKGLYIVNGKKVIVK